MFESKNAQSTHYTINTLRRTYEHLYRAIEIGQACGYNTQRLEIVVMNVYTARLQTERTLTCRSILAKDRRFLSKLIANRYG